MRPRNNQSHLPAVPTPALLPNRASRLLSDKIVWRPLNGLKPFAQHARSHPSEQVLALARSLEAFDFAKPVCIDEDGTILLGHCLCLAAAQLSMTEVPTLTLTGLSAAEKRALVIADNRIAEQATWDIGVLAQHFEELIHLDFEVELTGFTTGEIDLVLDAAKVKPSETEDDAELPDGPAVSRSGDVWELGPHRIICGDALLEETYRALLGDERAQMIVTDPPYNVSLEGHARGRSKKKHREFSMASGEMTAEEFSGFLRTAMERAIGFSQDGSIHYWFMDWRHLPELLQAGKVYSEWKNLLVWNKTNAGQGAFYRSKHELVAVFKAGTAPHINNFGLGAQGRHRTNVLDYSGGPATSGTRKNELDMHPTVKPVALIADLIRDCSRRNGLILDPFGGSGTTILAAERTGRKARVSEIDPLYVDLGVRRWQQETGQQARHAVTGKLFDEAADQGPENA